MARYRSSNVATHETNVIQVFIDKDMCIYYDRLPKAIREHLNYQAQSSYSAKEIYGIYRRRGLSGTLEVLEWNRQEKIKEHYSLYKCGVMWVKTGISV